MKRVIALMLLFCATAWGQESNPAPIYRLAELEHQRVVSGQLLGATVTFLQTDSLWYKSKDEYFIKVGLFLWNRYKQECYADSTLKRTHVGGVGWGDYCLMDWECLVSHHWKQIWHHRQPTFTGFMDWIEKQLITSGSDNGGKEQGK